MIRLKQFISVHDVKDINAFVEKALAYKANPLKDQELGKGKRMGLIFLNPSLRTRLSTQIAAENLGMQPIVFNVGSEGWSWEFEEEAIMSGTTVEHVKDEMHIGLFYAGYTEIEKGKTTMGANGEMILLEERTGGFQSSIEDVAERIVRHTRHRKKQSLVGVSGYLYSFLVRQFPSITERMINAQYKKVSKVYK